MRVPKAYAILRGKLQREPTIAEVAEWLGVDPQALDELIRAGAQATSLDAVLADGHRRLELIPAPEGPVDPGPAIAALEAMRRVDPDGAELLELLSEQSARDVAEAAGTTVRRLTDRARELRQRLRTLPEVEQALCA